MKAIYNFANNESGAVTVDWVVLTSAIVGIGIAMIILISGGVQEASNGILSRMNLDWSFASSSSSAQSFFDFGIEASPGNQDQAWRTARLQVDSESPTGYEYDPNLTTTRYVDNTTGRPIYVSDDGTNYSIDGEIVTASDYDTSDRTSFKSAFDQYWDQTQ